MIDLCVKEKLPSTQLIKDKVIVEIVNWGSQNGVYISVSVEPDKMEYQQQEKLISLSNDQLRLLLRAAQEHGFSADLDGVSEVEEIE